MHFEHERRAHDAGNHCYVVYDAKAELVEERGVDRIAGGDREQRVAVGGARTTASVARFALAPGRFSTTTGCPSRSVSHCAIRRAAMSVVPPAGNPTMMRTGRAG